MNIPVVQSYVRNDIAYEAVQNYIMYLQYKQDLYDSFVWDNYIAPNCYCHMYRRGNKDCYHCHLYEYTNYYKLSEFITCIVENTQYGKLLSYKP
jgi:hypothetical protein